jgi:hypothetical protein
VANPATTKNLAGPLSKQTLVFLRARHSHLRKKNLLIALAVVQLFLTRPVHRSFPFSVDCNVCANVERTRKSVETHNLLGSSSVGRY